MTHQPCRCPVCRADRAVGRFSAAVLLALAALVYGVLRATVTG